MNIICSRTTIAFILTLMTLKAVLAEIVYDVTFEDPPHTNGQFVTAGPGSDRPSFVDDTFISSNVPGFSSQVAITTNAGALRFDPGMVYTSGVHKYSWNFAMLSVNGGQIQVTVGLQSSDGSPSIRFFDVDYRTIGTNQDMILNVQGAEVTNIAQFVFAQVDHFVVIIDLDNDFFDLSLNGHPIVIGMPVESSRDISQLYFVTRPLIDPHWAVDNVRWEAVATPEMTDILTAIEVGYATQTGLTYQAQYADVVTATNWVDLGAPFVGDGSTNYVLHTTRDATNRIYRVILLP